MASFGRWYGLDDEGLEMAPDGPGAVQVGRADRQLVDYPKGKSAMVFYFFAARSVREALRRVFADEIAEPGARGQGALVFRYFVGTDDAQAFLETLFDRFVVEFGRAPILHPDDDDDDDDEDDE
ncbi:MAG TPA: hypothetical protein VGF99_09985 [Myxococcota bacterium]